MKGNPEMGKPPLIDMNAAAERLGTNHRHMRRLVSERRIPFVKVGRLIRFNPPDLDRWIDEQTVGASR